MTTIWQREWELILGTISISSNQSVSLDIEFNVEKSLGNEPNKASINIYNLSNEKRSGLSNETEIQLSAGYTGLSSVLFSGDIDEVFTIRDGPDFITKIESKDSGSSYRTSIFNVSYSENTNIVTVLRDCISSMGIGEGNLSQHTADLVITSTNASTFADGFTASGLAWRTLNNIVRSCGMRWSVQDGSLQLRKPGQPAELTAVVLRPGSGLVGSPSIDYSGEGRRRKATVSANAQLIPGLYPGRVVNLISSVISGNYRIKRVIMSGNTMSDEWNAALTLEDY